MFVYLCIRDLDSYDGPEVDVFESSDDARKAVELSGGVYQEQGVLLEDDRNTADLLNAMQERS